MTEWDHDRLRAILTKRGNRKALTTEEAAYWDAWMETDDVLDVSLETLTEEEQAREGHPAIRLAQDPKFKTKQPPLPRVPPVEPSGRRARSKRAVSRSGGEIKLPPVGGSGPPQHVGPPVPGKVQPGKGRKKR